MSAPCQCFFPSCAPCVPGEPLSARGRPRALSFLRPSLRVTGPAANAFMYPRRGAVVSAADLPAGFRRIALITQRLAAVRTHPHQVGGLPRHRWPRPCRLPPPGAGSGGGFGICSSAHFPSREDSRRTHGSSRRRSVQARKAPPRDVFGATPCVLTHPLNVCRVTCFLRSDAAGDDCGKPPFRSEHPGPCSAVG